MEQTLAEAALPGARESRPRPHHLLQEGLEQRRHGAEPEREDEDEVLGPGNRLGRLPQGFGKRAVLELPAAAEQRKVQPGDVETAHRVPGRLGAAGIGIGQRPAEARRVGIWVADDDQDAAPRQGTSTRAI